MTEDEQRALHEYKTLRVYRLRNLGTGEYGSPFCVCDNCLPYYHPHFTNNEDTRLTFAMLDLPEDAKCECYRHAMPKVPEGS